MVSAGEPEVANLDFEARVPVPFSVFPSSYRESETQTQTHTHEEVEIKLPQLAGREGQHSSFQAQATLPTREEDRFREEEVHITRKEEQRRRPGIREEFVYREEQHRPRPTTYSETHVEFDTATRPHSSVIDVAESEYRSRFQPSYRKEHTVTGTTVDVPRLAPGFKTSSHVDEYTVDAPSSVPVYKESCQVTGATVDPPAPRSTYHEKVDIVEEITETPRSKAPKKKSKMGYYDEDGHYHSLRQGLHKLADRVAHPFHHEGHHDRVEVNEVREVRRPATPAAPPNTVTIPCHHIRLGDILILQGRPCQVIRISTSAATGQHRYLGVDLFTKQLHEESSFVSNPAPSVVVQTMLGPVFKQYRVLDMQEGSIVAMTETGDVKQNLPVIDQSNLWARLQKSFETGRGSVRVLVVTDHGREMAVDMKVVHGSRL
ncbi:hypothetical protein N658DRAFT_506457 [Parathielavia hyrcaniae]|uniref:Translation initiation factor 5A-like N-terminal domain-containing protein n=1 Tax=Parathielavia hyrcaniae TaxID=113614 RepID=A0AAN6Q3P5_9PEZI|nr:hypothetical protein N658DRAFT_506457 [Parathielavia hyrcaniae]